MAQTATPAPANSQLKSFLSGGAGGVCLVLAGQPFDLLKVRMQTATGHAASTSALQLAKQTLKSEGVRGLYKGMAVPLVGVTPIFALCFWAYELGKSTLKAHRGLASDAQLSLVDVGVAGALSAVPTTLIMAPGERIKVILQTQQHARGGAGGRHFAGPLDVSRYLLSTGGLRSLYRGGAATLARDGTGSFVYFAVYEHIKRALTPEGRSLSPLAVVTGGGLAGVCNWLVALPLDVVKSRIQAQIAAAAAGAPAGGTSSSMLHVARQLVASEGVMGLYRGVGPALLRAFPANAACFLGMEASRAALDKLF